MTDGLSASDVALIQGNGRNGGFGDGDNAWWIVLFLIFGWGRGWGGNSDGFGGGSGYDYALITDNATLERKIDSVYSGICDSTFALNNTMTQGFAGLNTALVTQGYETRNAVTQDTIGNMQNTNLLQGAIKDCCCQTQQSIKDTQYVISNTGNAIQNQIQNCCCDVERQIERGFADTNYAMASQNCATLQAIDKVGDRIIDRLTQDKLDALRDENSALRLSASQSAQNQYLINQLRPCPQPAYVVPNPYCNCNCNNGYNYGTTIA